MSSKRSVWAKRIDAWRESGQSAAGFCRSRDLIYSQFVYWQQRVRGHGLVPVAVVASPEPCAAAAVELELPNGVRVRLTSVSIADVVALVRGVSC